MIHFFADWWKKIITWYGKLTVAGFLLLIIVILILGNRNADVEDNLNPIPNGTQATEVSLLSVAELSQTNLNELSFIGRVEATNQAQLVAEKGGRVTAVNTTLGQTVAAGQVLVAFENAAERAQLTQAEGGYQAALANQAQASTGITDAETALLNAQNSAVTGYSSAFSAVNQIFNNVLDQYYGNPTASIPGIRISGLSYTNYLNDERVAFRTLLVEWQQSSSILNSTDPNLKTKLDTAILNINRLINLMDVFITILPQQRTTAGTSGDEWRQQTDEMIQARNSVTQLRNSLQSALSGISTAEEALSRAKLGGSSSTNSLASAQVTQALGSLQAARANLNRTIVRAPISGTVTALPVRVGDNISPSALVVELINDSAQEIISYISPSDTSRLTVGDEVSFLNGGTGIVTAIAERVDQGTGKIEMRVASSDTTLTPGDTVRFSLKAGGLSDTPTELSLPLNTIRFIGNEANVFVVADNVLVLQPISVGTVIGNRVVITGGISGDQLIVSDARGKQVGQRVVIEANN